MNGPLTMTRPDGTRATGQRRSAWHHLDRVPRRLRYGLLVATVFSLGSSILQLALPLYSMQVFDRVLASGSKPTLIALSIIVGGLVVSGSLLDALRAKMLVRLGNILEQHWRAPLLEAAFRSSGTRPTGPGSLHDLDIVRSCVAGPTMAALLDLPWSSFFVVAVFVLSPPLGWLSVAAIGLVLAAAVAGETFSLRWSREGQARMGDAQRLFETSLAGHDAVLSMGAQAPLCRRIAALRDSAALCTSRSLDRLAWSNALARGLRNLLQVAVLMVAAFLVLSEQIPAGAIVACSMLFARALAPIDRVAATYRQLRAARLALLRLISTDTAAGIDRGRVLTLPSLTGRLDVTDLTAKRSPTAAISLEKISFTLAAGEMMALAGASGSGKSTLARSLVGITSPAGGTVRLDGAAISDWNPEELGRQVGFLSQEPQLLEGTITEVIARFGPIDDAKVIAAAQLAGAHELFLRLPQGYQTIVGRADHQLSVGERQRVALARAFYDDPALLVLDEPVAHLDDVGEKQVLMSILAAKKRGATVIIVSGKKSLLGMADHIMLLNRGRVQGFAPRAQVEGHIRSRPAPVEVDAGWHVKHATQG